jgi:hypothetical protein
MLNLRIAMRFLLFIFVVVTRLMSPSLVIRAQEAISTAEVIDIFLSPTPGQALQGIILIEGEYPADGISNVELSFSYKDDPRDTWFLIHELLSPEDPRLRVEWDTTTLTDGVYTLRIIVTTDQEVFIDYVADLRIRNYTAVETDTPAPITTNALEATIEATLIPTQTATPVLITATPLPTNPAQISSADIGLSIGKGVLIAFALLGIFGLYQYVRNRRRKQ